MAFDWGIFGQSLQNAANMVAGDIMDRYRQEEEQKRQIELMEKQNDLYMKRQDEEHKWQEGFQKRMAESQQQMERDDALWKMEMENRFNATLGSSELGMEIAQGMTSFDPMERLNAMAQLDVIETVKSGEQLNEQQQQVIQSFPPDARMRLAELIKENGRYKEEMELQRLQYEDLHKQREASWAYTRALTEKLQNPEFDELEAFRAISMFADRRSEILNNPQFQHLHSVVKAKGMDSLNDGEQLAYKFFMEGLAINTRAVDSITEHLTLRRKSEEGDKSIEDKIKELLEQSGGKEQEGVPTPSRRDRDRPSFIQRMMQPKWRDSRVRSEFGLSNESKIFRGHSNEDVEKIKQKAGAGDFLWDDDTRELFVFEIRNGRLGLVPYSQSGGE